VYDSPLDSSVEPLTSLTHLKEAGFLDLQLELGLVLALSFDPHCKAGDVLLTGLAFGTYLGWSVGKLDTS
jgi:hypothetical protein